MHTNPSNRIIYFTRAQWLSRVRHYTIKGYSGDFFARSYLDTITVHAPHPPSAHPSLVPHRPTVRVQRQHMSSGIIRLVDVVVRRQYHVLDGHVVLIITFPPSLSRIKRIRLFLK